MKDPSRQERITNSKGFISKTDGIFGNTLRSDVITSNGYRDNSATQRILSQDYDILENAVARSRGKGLGKGGNAAKRKFPVISRKLLSGRGKGGKGLGKSTGGNAAVKA